MYVEICAVSGPVSTDLKDPDIRNKQLNQFELHIYSFDIHPEKLRLDFISAFPQNRTHDLGIASTMLYCLSNRNSFQHRLFCEYVTM